MGWGVALVAALFIFLQPAEARLGGYGEPFMPPMFAPPMPPFFTNFTNTTCEDVHCGKGNCTVHSNHSSSSNGSSYSYSYSYSYTCNCESGWNQASLSAAFLPCIIPNCTLNHTCSREATRPPSPPVIDFSNMSALSDPCSWAMCGAGKCVKTSAFTYRCDCDRGYKNLLNNTMFPCYTECTLGMGCKQMEIGFGNLTTPSPSKARPPTSGGSNSGPSSSKPPPPTVPTTSSAGTNRVTAALHGVILILLLLAIYPAV